MKILFVAHSGEVSGGANRSLLSLMKRLMQDYGVEPYLLIPDSEGRMCRECEALEIPVFSFPYHSCCTVFQHNAQDILRAAKVNVAPIYDCWRTARLDWMLPKDLDLVYTNERMVAIGGFLAAHREIPHIWHIRSFGMENQTEYAKWYPKLIGKYADRVVCISEALRKTLQNVIPKKKTCVVYNGLEIMEKQLEKEPHEGFHILLTGRLVPPKGQDEAIRAVALLKNRFSINAELYLAGEIPMYGSNQYVQVLEKLIRDEHLEQHVHFLGEVDDMEKLRSNMDMELVCSWCEAFGRVTVEAMCAEIPVIGANTGGTPEILEDGKTGMLYPLHDVENLAEKIRYLYENPAVAAQMGQNGKARAIEHFSMDRTAQEINRVIEMVCSDESK